MEFNSHYWFSKKMGDMDIFLIQTYIQTYIYPNGNLTEHFSDAERVSSFSVKSGPKWWCPLSLLFYTYWNKCQKTEGKERR